MMTENGRPVVEIKLVVLGIDSNYDRTTALAFEYRQKNVYPYLVERGFTLEYCQGKLARRYYVALEAKDSKVVYITGSGHGLDDTFTGHLGENVFRVGDYSIEECQGKIVHLLSCNTAYILGIEMVKQGCLAFFGYQYPFTFVEATADVFFECDSEIDRAFADGLTAAEVYHRVSDLYQKRIQEYRDRYVEGLFNGEDDETLDTLEKTVSFLTENLNNLCTPSVYKRWGDRAAKLY